MTLSRRSTIKAIGVVGTGTAVSGTALAVNAHQDDERDADEVPDDEDVGAIRVGHFSPDAPNVDVYVDGQQILSDVGYDELSPYLEIVPGTYTITITAAGFDEPIHQETIAVDAEFYTAAVIGEFESGAVGENGLADDEGDDGGFGDGNATDALEDDGGETANETAVEDQGDDEVEDEAETGSFGILLLVDSQTDDVEEGTAPLRFVHAVPDAPAVDIADGETGAPIFEDVAFTEPSGYVPVEPGTRTIELFPADDGDLEGDGDESADETDESAADTTAATNETAEDANAGTDGMDVISQPDPVVTVDLELEADTAYTAFAIGYLEELDDEEVTVSEDEVATDEDAFGGNETDADEPGEGDETEADADEPAATDRAFSVRVAVDGEMRDEDEADTDDEPGVEDDELEPEEDADESAAEEPTEPTGDSLEDATPDERNATAEESADDSMAADD